MSVSVPFAAFQAGPSVWQNHATWVVLTGVAETELDAAKQWLREAAIPYSTHLRAHQRVWCQSHVQVHTIAPRRSCVIVHDTLLQHVLVVHAAMARAPTPDEFRTHCIVES